MNIHKFILTVVMMTAVVSPAIADSFSQVKQIWENAYRNRQFSWAQNDFKQALIILEDAVKEGYGEAAYMVGLSYLNEYGVERDLAKAKEFFQKGLDLGYEKGNLELGDILVPDSATVKEGIAAWKKAYAHGEYGATGRYAMAEYYGLGDNFDQNKAFMIASENFEESANDFYNGWQLAMLGDFMVDENDRYPITKPANLVKKADRIAEAAALYYQSNIPNVQLVGAKLLLKNGVDYVRPKLIHNGGLLFTFYRFSGVR